MERSNPLRLWFWSLGIFILVFIAALKWGAVADANLDIILDIRLPRVLLAAALGMGLSLSGAALQALFSNPLCDPYTLGISSGASLGAVIGASLGLDWMLGGIAGASFLGALLFAGILYWIARNGESKNVTLLLAGIMLGFLGSSLVTIWIVRTEPNGVQGMMIWLFGDLSRARLSGAIVCLVGVKALGIVLWSQWRGLDGLLLGEEEAGALGVNVNALRIKVIVLSSLIIALCVSAGGVIGFVGLVVPHFVRRLVGSLHFVLLPLCAIWGGTALIGADCLARMITRPYELPVGAVTALIGAPLFLWIMLRKRERQ
jgi:iron complex transport system permease protein